MESNWQNELSEYLQRVGRETATSLAKIENALHGCGLEFNSEFRKYFMSRVDERLMATYDLYNVFDINKERYSNHTGIRVEGKAVKNSTKKSRDGKSMQKPHKEVKRLKKSKTDKHKRPPKRSHDTKRVSKKHRSERKRVSPDTQVAVVSSSSSRKIKPESDSNHGPDAMANPFKMAKIDFEVGLDQGAPHQIHLKNLSFSCFHCATSNQTESSTYERIEDVYIHWIVSHRRPSTTMPFQFSVAENVACYFCDKIDSYQMILKHQRIDHPNESIVIVTEADRRKCALCSYSDEPLLGHFEIEHELLLQVDDFNPLCLDDDALNGILNVDIRRRYCDLCVKIFSTIDELAQHRSVKHPKEGLGVAVGAYDDVEYLICPCRSIVDSAKYFDHIRGHFKQFYCIKCQFQTDNLVDLVDHDKITHQMNSMKFHCLQLSDRLLKYYFSTKIAFSSGLVLIMHNLLHTKFDMSKHVAGFIEELLGERTAELQIDRSDDGTKIKKQVTSKVTSLISKNAQKLKLHIQNKFACDLAIEGIPKLEGEDLKMIFLAMCNEIGIKLTLDDIKFIVRLSGHARQIIQIRFVSRQDKLKVLNHRYMKDLKTGHFMALPVGVEPTQVYINQYMTKYFCNISKIAKDAMKKKKLYRYNLDMDGIFVKRTKHSRGRHILSETELINYIGLKME